MTTRGAQKNRWRALRRVAVLFGGPSSERAISIRTAAAVRRALSRMGLSPIALEVSPRVAESLREHRINLAFLATHGTVGEDGRLQGLLDVLGIPYTGSGVRASALAMHKPSAKRIFQSAGLPTPRWAVVPTGELTTPPRLGLRLPLVVKPAEQGSAVGVTVARTLREFQAGLKAAGRVDAEVLVEEYVAGTEITVGLLGDRILPVVEILPQHAFYDFHSKYAPGGSRHILPARLTPAVYRRSQELAVAAFHVLGCRHVGRVDLIVDRRGRPTLLEVNTLPGLTATSLLPEAARAVGLNFAELVGTLLTLALETHGRPAT
ncbi:MAG: D-alanine--D-alanine ligase [Elusimicrobia bacterium]|nr:D-alanine--D-alanine ligase [Elusimicrobiota bacterium]